jgi:hypothetical protein
LFAPARSVPALATAASLAGAAAGAAVAGPVGAAVGSKSGALVVAAGAAAGALAADRASRRSAAAAASLPLEMHVLTRKAHTPAAEAEEALPLRRAIEEARLRPSAFVASFGPLTRLRCVACARSVDASQAALPPQPAAAAAPSVPPPAARTATPTARAHSAALSAFAAASALAPRGSAAAAAVVTGAANVAASGAQAAAFAAATAAANAAGNVSNVANAAAGAMRVPFDRSAEALGRILPTSVSGAFGRIRSAAAGAAAPAAPRAAPPARPHPPPRLQLPASVNELFPSPPSPRALTCEGRLEAHAFPAAFSEAGAASDAPASLPLNAFPSPPPPAESRFDFGGVGAAQRAVARAMQEPLPGGDAYAAGNDAAAVEEVDTEAQPQLNCDAGEAAASADSAAAPPEAQEPPPQLRAQSPEPLLVDAPPALVDSSCDVPAPAADAAAADANAAPPPS